MKNILNYIKETYLMVKYPVKMEFFKSCGKNSSYGMYIDDPLKTNEYTEKTFCIHENESMKQFKKRCKKILKSYKLIRRNL